MTQCGDGTWCCGQANETSCCNKNLGFQLAASIASYATSGVVVSAAGTTMVAVTGTSKNSLGISDAIATTSALSSTNGNAPFMTSGNSASSTNGSASSSTSGSNNLTIGLGVALGVVILAMVALVFFLRRILRARSRGDGQGEVTGSTPKSGASYYENRTELAQPVKIHEFPNRREPAEML